MILIAGEALIDMVYEANDQGRFCAYPGGAAFNVACAAGQLAMDVGFICPISKDTLGDLLLTRLAACDATPILSERVNAPTPLALVTVDKNNQPSYQFYREGTADRSLAKFSLADVIPSSASTLHITGICLNEQNDYRHWLTLVNSALAKGMLLSVDPNVRANLIEDEDDYRHRIHQLIRLAHIVKVSDEDLRYLYPNKNLSQAKLALSEYVPLVIVTLGAKGAEALWRGNQITIPAAPVTQMVDTVGSGDCFAGAYLYGLQQQGVSTPDAIETLSQEQVLAILHLAARAAAINCARKGCQPPHLSELDVFHEE